jgi:alpha-aminoadipate carrier protein LysW
MATCPECEEELEIDELDVEEGDVISCDQCGSTLRVSSTVPLELEPYDEDDDEDEEDEDEEEGEEEDEYDDRAEDEGGDWDE